MQLRHPPHIASVTCHKVSNWKRVTVLSIFIALYAIAGQWGYMTMGEPLAWSLNEQKRILRKKAQSAKDKGIIVGEDTTGKKGKRNELKIDEEELPSAYLPNAWCCLFILLTFGSTVLFNLMTKWSLKFKTMMLYEPSEDINESSFLLIMPPQAKGKGELTHIQEPNINSNYTFDFQHIRYEITDEDFSEDLIGEGEYSCKLIQSPTGNNKEFYRSGRGMQSEDEIEKNYELFGQNIFELPYPTFLELFQKQLESPIVAFQLMCAFLWAMDTYWKYTMFTLVTILGFEASTAFQRLKAMSMLRGMSYKAADVWVYRRNRWVGGIAISELLPGDIVSLTSQPKSPAELARERENREKEAARALELAATKSKDGKDKNAKEVKEGENKEAAVAAPPINAPRMDIMVPCDCVILYGGAIVNEASLTGESVPQMKDAIPATQLDVSKRNKEDEEEENRPYDMWGRDKVHTLYSGTVVIQATNTKATGVVKQDEHEMWSDIQAPPDGGCVCYCLRTGFSSSQGELMRMIEFSQESVTADKKEMTLQLLFLFLFALFAAGYVLKKGLEDPERPTYKVLLRCVLIITQVVPPSLPMQMAFAVHTALVGLNKNGIYCTEPFRVPEAGKVMHCFFDKTGTLTSDHMLGTGLVFPISQNQETKYLALKDGSASPQKRSANQGGGSGAGTIVPSIKDIELLDVPYDTCITIPAVDSDRYKECALPMGEHRCAPGAFVLAGCNALIEVNGKLCGDPIEIAALRGIQWSYHSDTATCVPGTHLAKEKALKQIKELQGKETDGTKKAQMKKDIIEYEATYKIEKQRSEVTSVAILQRHHFASALQRMSTVVTVTTNPDGPGGRAEGILRTGCYAFVKGSPEAIFKLLDPKIYKKTTEFEQNYNASYRSMAEQGHRVLGLAYRCLGKDISKTATSKHEKTPRSEIESNLRFAGFASYKCETRKDSKLVIQSLNDSGHNCIMVTGDAALTAYSVAKECNVAQRSAVKALILSDDASHWSKAVTRSEMKDIPFRDAEEVVSLSKAGHDLVLTGKALESASQRFGDELWDKLKHVCVFARLSPQQKEEIIRSIGGHRYDDPASGESHKKVKPESTLMCGDGGNDVGALKQADVGVALLSGFGNQNVNVKEKKEKSPTDFLTSFFGGEEQAEEEEEEDSEETKNKKLLGKSAAEEELARIKKEEAERFAACQKKIKDDLKTSQAGMFTKQQQYVEEEMERRRRAGLDTGMVAHMQVMQDVMAKMKKEMAEDIQNAQKKHTSSYVAGTDKWTEGLEAMEDSTQIKLGDASMAAPFTSRHPTISSVIDIVRQGRCTLLSAVQQMQIMMLDSMISAYSLSVMSADGARPSEQQMMASGTFMSVAAIAFNFARPLDRLHPVRPLSSVFHPALFMSLMGQIVIHLACMVFISNLARELMGEAELKEVLKFEKERNEKINLMDEEEMNDLWWFMKVPFRPNLLNTMVWLVEVSQQISVMFVNYKGRPWMRGMLENQALFLSLFGCLAMVWICASNVIPFVNETLRLVVVPEEARAPMMIALFASLFGAFMWDRLMHFIFAREIADVMWTNVKTTTFEDFWPVLRSLGIAGGILLVLGSGNIFTLIGGYYLYKQYYGQNAAAGGGGAAAAKS